MKVVLVSGAGGFLGRHAVEALLTQGYRVHGLSRRPPTTPECVWHRADLFDPDSVRPVLEAVRPSHLLHVAWDTTHGRYWSSPDNLRWVEATLALCRLFREVGGQRFVGVGTCAEYAWTAAALGDGPVREEETPRAPDHFYGIAKNAAFELLRAYGGASGLEVAWARVFFPYGPHDVRPRLIPSIIQALHEGRPAPCTHGSQQRDFIHARDVGAALAALSDSRVTGAVNVASGLPIPIAEVARCLGDLMGRPDLIRLGALEARPNEPAALVADTGRLRTEVGFVPKITLTEGLRDTVRWWTQQAAREERGTADALHG